MTTSNNALEQFQSSINSWFSQNLMPQILRLGLNNSNKAFVDITLVLAFAVPLSLLLYMIFDRYSHKILVDLGNHQWIIRFK